MIWEEVRFESEPKIPTVVCPLGVEPKKPRALWDGRYVNKFCRDVPFHMDNAAKVAEMAWLHTYFFKLHIPAGTAHSRDTNLPTIFPNSAKDTHCLVIRFCNIGKYLEILS